jgi:hypothetical protein
MFGFLVGKDAAGALTNLRVLYAEKGHPLAAREAAAHDAGSTLVLAADNPIAKAALASHQ